jgi:hypothetical protein
MTETAARRRWLRLPLALAAASGAVAGSGVSSAAGSAAGSASGSTVSSASGSTVSSAWGSTVSSAAGPAASSEAGHAAPPVQAAPQPLAFTVIGDTPYSHLEERTLTQVLAAQEADVAFVLHLGDLKSGWESCSDDLLRRRHALLRASPRPVFFVPGDNEWVDCIRAPAGGFDPLDRLALLRRLFHEAPPPPRAGFDAFERQSQTPGSPPFPEHARWLQQGVAFLTVNLPGSRNATSNDTRLQQANAQRMIAVRQWLAQAPAWAQARQARALVVASHANPGFERDPADRPPIAPHDPDDAYAGWRAGLRELARVCPLPILLLHGDTHSFQIDQPLRDAAGRRIRQLTRVECFGTPRSAAWVRVSVPPTEPARFVITARQLAVESKY